MITIIIVAITSLISIYAFNNQEVFYKLQLNPYQIVHRKQYARLFGHAFLHADWTHLIVNMLVLYSFGRNVEIIFKSVFGANGGLYFLFLYIGAILVSPVYALIKHKDNYYYNAVGASGAVSAVAFTSIFFFPWEKIYFFGLLPLPGIVFAILYLVYSYYMGKKNKDHIAHDAHLWGAVFGLAYPIILKAELFKYFIDQLLSPLK